MVRVALHEKGLKYQHNIIKLCDHYDDADNLSKEFLAEVNPTGVVPVLKIGNEFVRDSAYIIERLDELTGSNSINLWPQDTNKRDELVNYLQSKQVTSLVHYNYILPELPQYNSANTYPNAASLKNTSLSLPLFPELHNEEVEYVINSICSFFRRG